MGDLTQKYEASVVRHKGEEESLKTTTFLNNEDKAKVQGRVDATKEAKEVEKKKKDDHYNSIM